MKTPLIFAVCTNEKKKKIKKKERVQNPTFILPIYITHLYNIIVNIHVITRETSFNVQNVCTV